MATFDEDEDEEWYVRGCLPFLPDPSQVGGVPNRLSVREMIQEDVEGGDGRRLAVQRAIESDVFGNMYGRISRESESGVF